jgi:hypothetical protein
MVKKGVIEAVRRITEGDKQVAKGEDRISVAERHLHGGELELHQGIEQLMLAKGARNYRENNKGCGNEKRGGLDLQALGRVRSVMLRQYQEKF